MVESACAIAALVVSYIGFSALALRQRPHHGAVAGSRHGAVAGSKRPTRPTPALRRRLLLSGGCALALCLVLSLFSQGPSFGSLLFSFALSAGALGAMFTLTYRPHWLRPLQRGLFDGS